MSKDDLVEHNQEWARRFEEEEIMGENNENARIWRLNPRSMVRHELELRSRHVLLPEHKRLVDCGINVTYGQEFPAFYEMTKGRLYSRNGFQEDSRWPIDLNRARVCFQERELERKAAKYNIEPKILSEMKSMAAYEPHYIERPSGVFVEYYDDEGTLVRTIKIK